MLLSALSEEKVNAPADRSKAYLASSMANIRQTVGTLEISFKIFSKFVRMPNLLRAACL